MSNGYTVVPGIIPGPLQVGGPLTITNGQIQTGAALTPLAILNDVLQIGANAAFTRIMRDVMNQNLVLSYNLAKDGITRDDAAQNASQIRMGQVGNMPLLRRLNSAGTILDGVIPQTLGVSGVPTTITGNVAENTVFSQLLPANSRNATLTGMILPFLFISNAQGAVSTTFRLKIGATVIFAVTRAALGDMFYLAFLYQQTSILLRLSLFLSVGATQGSQSDASVADNTTADQTLSLTIQLGAATDSWTVAGGGILPFTSA